MALITSNYWSSLTLKPDLNSLPGEASTSKENRVDLFDSETETFFDFLLFFDSRGMCVDSGSNHGLSHLVKLQNWLRDNKKSFLSISRPKNLTTFATLFNFLKAFPDLHFRNLVTNLGIVDCTPKKLSNLDDLKKQILRNSLHGFFMADAGFFTLCSGDSEQLHHFIYTDDYAGQIASELRSRFKKHLFIPTTEIGCEKRFKRARPDKFYTQLAKTNELVRKISSKTVTGAILDLDRMNQIETFDGIHLIDSAHQTVFEMIVENLSC